MMENSAMNLPGFFSKVRLRLFAAGVLFITMAPDPPLVILNVISPATVLVKLPKSSVVEKCNVFAVEK